MSKLRIAIVGAGTGRGQSWMQSMAKLSEPDDLYNFCGLCEVFADKAKASSETWGVPAYSTLLELIDAQGPDVVLGAAPPDCNMMTMPIAAARGIHVMTEIPIAPTCAMADHLMGVAREAGIKYEVCEQVYMWADEQLKRKIIADGLIGEVQHARLYYTNKADSHGINGARMLLPGKPVRVQGATGAVSVPTFQHFSGDMRSDDTWDRAVIEFDNGVCLLFDSPPRARMNRRWDIEGSAGQLFGESLFLGGQGDFQEYPFITEYADVRGEKVLDHVRVDTDPPVVFENPYRQYRADSGDEVARMDLLIGMHRAITEDTEPIYGPENAKLDLEILYAMRESARLGGGWVDLPLTAPTELERRTEQAFVEDYGHDWRDAEGLVDVPFPQGGVRYTVGNWD